MKKILSILLVMTLILTGCDSTKEEEIASNNDLSSLKEESKTEETSKTTESVVPACTAKKFSKTYSYVYTTKQECVSKGNDAFMEVYDNIDDSIFTYGCEEIVDDCGTTWYGVYFNRWSESGVDEVIRIYY